MQYFHLLNSILICIKVGTFPWFKQCMFVWNQLIDRSTAFAEAIMPAMICSSWHTGPVTRSKNKRKNESLGRAVAQKSRVLKRISKKDSVLVKHLAWLRELQENKTRLQEEKKLEEERKLERRRLLKENRHSNTKKLVSQANGTSSLGEATSSPSPKTDEARSKVERPAWCRPEATQSEAEEHADDENALLDYIDQLNFDQYNEDLELQTLIGQVKDRIKSLEKDKRKDEKMLKACTDVSAIALCILFPCLLSITS